MKNNTTLWLNAFLRKQFLLLFSFLAVGLLSVQAQGTYTWGAGVGSVTSPGNWTTAGSWNKSGGGTRTATNVADVLIFDGTGLAGAPIYVGSIPTQTIGKLILQNGANVVIATAVRTTLVNTISLTAATGTQGTFNAVAASTSATLSGTLGASASLGDIVYNQFSTGAPVNVGQILTYGPTFTTSCNFGGQGSSASTNYYKGNILSISQASGFMIDATSTLNLSAGNVFGIRLLTNATGTVSGIINVTTAGQRIITQDATGLANAVSGALTFASGSALNITNTIYGNVFDYYARSGNDNVVFQSGSSYNLVPPVQATATATISGGAVTGITFTNRGTGYVITPTFTFSGGGGSGATMTPLVGGVNGNTSVMGGALNSSTITGGSGYTSAPTVTISYPSAQTVSGVGLPLPYNGNNSLSCVTFNSGSSFSMNGVGTTFGVNVSTSSTVAAAAGRVLTMSSASAITSANIYVGQSVSGTNIPSGTTVFSISGATITLTADVTGTGVAISSVITFGNANFLPSIGARTFPNFSLVGSTFSASGNLTINGTLGVDATSTLTMGNNQLLSGTLSTISGTGTINTASTNAAPIPASQTWTQLVNYNSASAQTVVAGTYKNGLNLTGGARTLPATLNISGAYTAGAGTITVGTGTVSFSGTSSIASASSFYNLAVGDGTTSTPVTLGGAVAVTNSLTFTSGAAANITLGNNNLTLASAPTIASPSGTRCFITNGTGGLTINAVPTSSTLFPISTGTSYAPLTLSGGTAGSNITASVKGTFDNTPKLPSQVVNLQWSLAASAPTKPSVTFQYNSADQAASYSSTGAVLAAFVTGQGYTETPLTSVSGSNPYTTLAIDSLGSTKLYGIGNPLSFKVNLGVPRNVTAVVASATSATVSFDPPSDVTGVTSYRVTVNGGAGGTVSGTSPITITGLTAGNSYTFSVQSTDGTYFSVAGVSNALVTNTYTWKGGTSNDMSSANWTPARTSPLSSDVLQFDGNNINGSNGTGPITVTTSTQTIGQLNLLNNANVSLVATTGAGQKISIAGVAGSSTGLTIPSGTTLRLAPGAAATDSIAIAFSGTNLAATIAGNLIIDSSSTTGYTALASKYNNVYYAVNSLTTVTGTITNGGSILCTAANFVLSANSNYISNGMNVNSVNIYFPTTSYTNANVFIQGLNNSALPIYMSFPNSMASLTINCPNLKTGRVQLSGLASGSTVSITNDFTITLGGGSTGATLSSSANAFYYGGITATFNVGGNLNINNAMVHTSRAGLPSNWVVTGDMNVSNGGFYILMGSPSANTINGGTYSLTVNGNYSQTGSSSQVVLNNEANTTNNTTNFIVKGNFSKTAGTFTFIATGSSTSASSLQLAGASPQTFSTDVALTTNANSTVEIANTGTAPNNTVTLNSALNIGLGSLKVTSGKLLTAASATVNVGGNLSITGGTLTTGASSTLNVTGNWSNTGTFTAGSTSSVVFNGTNQTITGANSFVNFTKSATAAATLTLPVGVTQTFTGKLTLNGPSSSNLLTIKSAIAGTVATINYNPSAANALFYNTFQDVTNGTATALNTKYSTDGGNNTNITFIDLPQIWNGSTSTSWKDANNWTPNIVPAASDVVVVSKSGSYDIVLDTAATVIGVTIASGNTLSFNGYNLVTTTFTNRGTANLGNDTLTVNGTYTNNGTFNANSGGLKLYGSFIDSSTFNAGTSTVAFNTTAAVSGPSATLFNNVTISSADTLTGNVKVGGALTLGSTSTSVVTGTVTFNGAALQTIPRSTGYNNLTLNNSAGAILADSITVAGNLTLQSGTLADRGYNLKLRGNILGAGTHTSGGFKMTGVSFAAGATSITLPSRPNYVSINTGIYAAGFDRQTRVTKYDSTSNTIYFTPATLTAGSNVTLYNVPPGSTVALSAFTWTGGNTVTLASSPAITTGFVIGYPITGTNIPTGTIITAYDSAAKVVNLSQTPTASGTFNAQSIGKITAQNATVASNTTVTLGDASGNLMLGNIIVGNTTSSAGATAITLGNTVDVLGRLTVQFNTGSTNTNTSNYLDLNEQTLNCHGIIVAPAIEGAGWVVKAGSSTSTNASLNIWNATGQQGTVALGAITLRFDTTINNSRNYLKNFQTTAYGFTHSGTTLTLASDVKVQNFILGAANVVVNTSKKGIPASLTIYKNLTLLYPVLYGNLVGGGSNSIRFSNTTPLTLPAYNVFGTTIPVNATVTTGSKTVKLKAPNLNIQPGFTIGNTSTNPVAIESNTTVAAYDGDSTITLSKPALANATTAGFQFIGSPYGGTTSDIIIDGGSSVTMGSSLSFGGSLTISNNSALNVGSYTLGLYTDALSVAAGSSINSTSASSLVLGGIANNLSVPTSITALNNLTLNNTSGVTLNNNISLAGTLSLLNGTLKNSVSNNVTLANAATINISGGGFSVAPSFGSTVNVEYRANSQTVSQDSAQAPVAYTTGKEIPVASSVLNNVSFNAYALSEYKITNGGAGYSNPPNITVGNAWAASTAYTKGDQVISAGNLYTCTQTGTTSSSSANQPSDLGNAIADSTVLWDYVGVAPGAYCKISGGQVTAIIVTRTGTGFTSAPPVTIIPGGNNAGVTTTATATAVLSAPTVTLGSNATINGKLDLIYGKLLLSLYNLTVGSSASAISVGNENSYILTDTTGKLIRTNVPLSTATAFPMGIVGSYTPLTITNTAGAASTMSVGARRYFNHSVGDSTQALFLQWSVLGTVATTSNITYQFNTRNQAPDFIVTDSCELGTYKTSYVATQVGVPAKVNDSVYTVTASGLTVPTTGNNFYVIGNKGNIVVTATTWTGGAGTTNWRNFDNWDNNVPTVSVDAIIPNMSIRPILDTTQSVKSLTVNSGAVLTIINPGVLQITRDFTNYGTVNGTGTLSIKGTAAQAIYGTGVVNNVTLDNSTGATISNTGANRLNVTGILTVKSGTLATTTNGNLTLKSISIDSSATVAPLVGSIAGSNVTVERFIPMALRAYRDIAPGVTTTTSIFTNWQEAGASPTGYGTYITGAVGSTAGDSAGLDKSYSGTRSLFQYVDGTWSAVTNTRDSLLRATKPYRILIRGDRRFNIFTTPQGGGDPRNGPGPMQSPTTLRATGTLYTGNYNAAVMANGFTMVANPYVCPIDFNAIAKTAATGSSFWYLDPTIGNANKYVVYNATTGTSNNPFPFYSDSTLVTGSSVNRYIQAGQAFFVKNTTGSAGTLAIQEAHKAPSSTKTAVFDVAEPVSKIAVGLFKQSTTSTSYRNMDGAVVVFKNSFSNGVGDEDSYKINGASDNLAIVSDSLLSIEGRQPVTEKDTIALLATGLDKTLGYRLRIDASNFAGNGVAPYLYDSYKNTVTALDANKVNTIDFAVDANVASSGQRFSLVFKPTVLAVNSIVVAAKATANGVQVNWNTVGEHGAISYEVERSTNGISFSKQSTVAAKNTATASYSYTDGKPASGDNYYRIKAIGTTGVNYSQVVLVKAGVSAALVSVYPNPLSGNKLVVNLSSVAAGNYRVRLQNSLGQQVVTQLIKGGAEAVVTVGALAAGNYQVSVSDANGNPIYQTKLVAAK